MERIAMKLAVLFLVGLVAACASAPDYEKLRAADPVRILVIPPLNQSPELKGTYTFLSTISMPLAEKGYYVYPVAVVDEYFKANGVPTPEEMNNVDIERLNEQFLPDAILYTRLDYFGQKYSILSSNSEITGELKLIDARTGDVLWMRQLYFNDGNQQQNSSLIGLIVGALVTQVVASIGDSRFFEISTLANTAAINAPKDGLLVGAMLREGAK